MPSDLLKTMQRKERAHFFVMERDRSERHSVFRDNMRDDNQLGNHRRIKINQKRVLYVQVDRMMHCVGALECDCCCIFISCTPKTALQTGGTSTFACLAYGCYQNFLVNQRQLKTSQIHVVVSLFTGYPKSELLHTRHYIIIF